MSKFKKGGRGAAPAVNTSSLPDIVFMLLFFFMVATTSKEVDPTVKVDYTPGQKSRDLTPYKQRSEVEKCSIRYDFQTQKGIARCSSIFYCVCCKSKRLIFLILF